MIQKIVVTFLISFIVVPAFSQKKVENIYFHLYTDSLKKGQHNYINIDGLLANGRWLPMTSKDVTLSCKEATFEGNELIIPIDFKEEKVTIRATLIANPSLSIEKIIWIKQKPDEEFLPSAKEVMQGNKTKSKRN